jgi:hypothetical protein
MRCTTRRIGLAAAMLWVTFGVAGPARADLVYTFELDAIDVTISNQQFHYDTASFSFTTPNFLTSFAETTVGVNPAGDLNGFAVTSVTEARGGQSPEFTLYVFSSQSTDFNQPVGTVAGFFVELTSVDHVGIYTSDVFGRGVADGFGDTIYSYTTGSLTISGAAVPEPSTLVLASIAALVGWFVVGTNTWWHRAGRADIVQPIVWLPVP